jgi:hypothetical protein
LILHRVVRHRLIVKSVTAMREVKYQGKVKFILVTGTEALYRPYGL